MGPLYKRQACRQSGFDFSHFNISDLKLLYRSAGMSPGLRGVLSGPTAISKVVGFRRVSGDKHPVPGRLIIRGVPIERLMMQFDEAGGSRLEQMASHLLLGDYSAFEVLSKVVATQTDVSSQFLELAGPMNAISSPMRRIMFLLPLVMSMPEFVPESSFQAGLQNAFCLLNMMPKMVAFACTDGEADIENTFVPGASIAENVLRMVQGVPKESAVDPAMVELLDQMLVLHVEHGGGNNSTSTVRGVASARTDLVSAVLAGTASLNGDLHGSANRLVETMMETIRDEFADMPAEERAVPLKAFLTDIVAGRNQQIGKVFGLGHATYTQSDPRYVWLREKIDILITQIGQHDQVRAESLREKLSLYDEVAALGAEALHDVKGVLASPNVDFLTGFIYKEILGLEPKMFTPLFLLARSVGWATHWLEVVQNNLAIQRPTTLYVGVEE